MAKHDAMGFLRRAWKSDPALGHISIAQNITDAHSKVIKDMQNAMTWERMCVTLGSEEHAL